jgi:hypothetical protein
MRNLIATTALAFVMGAGSSFAAVVDFGSSFGSSLSEGTILTAFDFGNGLTGSIDVFSNAGGGGAGNGLIFDTEGTVGVANDADLEGPFENAMDASDIRSFGNALIIQNFRGGIDDEARGGRITFNFDRQIILNSLMYLDGEEGATVTAGAFSDSFGRGVSGDNLFVELSSFGGSLNPVSSFTVMFRGSGAIGSFDADVFVSPVPLPASLPLALLGLGAFGALRLRRRKT